MGNCECLSLCEVNFQIEKLAQKNNIIITKIEENKEVENIIIFENVTIEDDFEKFINIINNIYKTIGNLSYENQIVLKQTIKSTISNILNEQSVNIYLNEINNLFKNNQDLNTIIKIVEIIYSKRMDIGKDKIICFIENLSNILKDSTEFKDNNRINCFYNNLKNIFLKDIKKIKITNKNIKKKILKKITKKPNEMICEKENEDEKDDEKENINITKSKIEDVQNILEKYNKSIASKYSANSKHQIAKLEEKIKNLEKQIQQKNSENNIINIIFYDELDKKEYPLKVNNNEIDFEELKKFLYKKYPNLESKDIKKFSIAVMK